MRDPEARFGEKVDEPIIYEAELIIRLASTHLGHPTERAVRAKMTFVPGNNEPALAHREMLHIPAPVVQGRGAREPVEGRYGELTLCAHRLARDMSTWLMKRENWNATDPVPSHVEWLPPER